MHCLQVNNLTNAIVVQPLVVMMHLSRDKEEFNSYLKQLRSMPGVSTKKDKKMSFVSL